MSTRVAAVWRRCQVLADHVRLSAATSLPVVVVTTVASAFNSSYLRPGVYSEQMWLRLFLVLLSAFVVFLPLRLWWRRVRRGAPEPTPGRLMLAVLGLSVARSALVTYALSATGYEPGFQPGALFSAVWFAVWVVVGAMLVDAMRQEVDRVNRISALSEAIDLTRRDCSDALRQERSDITREVAQAVLPCVDDIGHRPSAEGVEQLRSVAHGVVRPMSHDLAARTPDLELPPVKVSDYRMDLPLLAVEATRPGRMPITPMAVVAFVLPVVYHFAVPIGGLPVLPAAASAVLVWLAGCAMNRMFAKRIAAMDSDKRALALTLEFFTLASLYLVLGQQVLFDAERLPRAAVSALVLVPALGWLLLLFGSVSRLHEGSAARVEELSERLRWEVARGNAELRAQRRQLSRQLHGPLQAALNAGAVRVDRAQTEYVDEELATAVRKSIVEAMTELVFERFRARDVHMALERVRGTWSGLCEIGLDDPDCVIDELGSDAVCASAATDIITEACSDSVRHGRASHVQVSLRRNDDVVHIEVIDDGTGVIEGWQAGLGSAFLDAVTVSWSRESSGAGTRLVADIPFGSGGIEAGVPLSRGDSADGQRLSAHRGEATQAAPR